MQRRARHRRQGLTLRIALNLCSVMHDGGDLVGDGINVAARLQEKVGRDGIIITHSVYGQIPDQPEMEVPTIGRMPCETCPIR